MRPALLIPIVAAAIFLGACGDADDDTVATAPSDRSTATSVGSASELDAAALTVSESCGHRFIARDAVGSLRLTIVPDQGSSDTGAEPGRYTLGDGGWTGQLELGSGLVVWPCHDIGSDFDREQVDAVWTVVGGSVELLDPIPGAESGGAGVTTPVRARAITVEVEDDDGARSVLADVELVSDRWGFFGG